MAVSPTLGAGGILYVALTAPFNADPLTAGGYIYAYETRAHLQTRSVAWNQTLEGNFWSVPSIDPLGRLFVPVSLTVPKGVTNLVVFSAAVPAAPASPSPTPTPQPPWHY